MFNPNSYRIEISLNRDTANHISSIFGINPYNSDCDIEILTYLEEIKHRIEATNILNGYQFILDIIKTEVIY